MKNTNVFRCPSSTIAYPSAYGLNFRGVDLKIMAQFQTPAETVVFMDANQVVTCPPNYTGGSCCTSGGQNPPGTGRWDQRHMDGMDVGWLDGHVKWTQKSTLVANPKWFNYP